MRNQRNQRNHNSQIDPSIARVMKKVAAQKGAAVHVSIVTYNVVLLYKKVIPSSFIEGIRIKNNIPKNPEVRPGAIEGRIVNSEEGAYLELLLDGRVIAYDVVHEAKVTLSDRGERLHNYTRNDLDWGWLCINGRRVEKIYSAEGIKKLVG